MTTGAPLEDWRGVDLSQIRELLELSVAERAAEMRVNNMMIEIQERARAANRPEDRMALPYLESLRDELGNG